MPNRIILRRGSGVPNVSNFAIGEPAFSSQDGKFYIIGGTEANKKVFQVWTDQNDILDTRTSGTFKVGSFSAVDVSIVRNSTDYIKLTSSNITVSSSIIPSTSAAYDLGSSTSKFRTAYLSGGLYASRIGIDTNYASAKIDMYQTSQSIGILMHKGYNYSRATETDAFIVFYSDDLYRDGASIYIHELDGFDVIYHYVGAEGVYYDVTSSLISSGGVSVPILASTSDAIYLGCTDTPFRNIYIETEPGSGYSLIFEYWNGSTWVQISNVSDGTNGLSQSGWVDLGTTISTRTTVGPDSTLRYYLRIRTASTPTTVAYVYAINLGLFVSSIGSISGVFNNKERFRIDQFGQFISFPPEGRMSFISMRDNPRITNPGGYGFIYNSARNVDSSDIFYANAARYNLDTVYYYDGSSYMDITNLTTEFGGNSFSLFYSTGELLYFGRDSTFSELYFKIDYGASGYNIVWEYWNGSTWATLNVSDGTKNFLESGWVFWSIPSDWAKTSVNGNTKYWIRARTTSLPSLEASSCSFINISGFTGNFARFYSHGREKFKIDYKGQVYSSGVIYPGSSAESGTIQYSSFISGSPTGIGINAVSSHSTLYVSGSVASAITTVTSNTTLSASHSTVQVNASNNNVTIALPAASTCRGRIYVIKKIDNTSNLVILDPNGNETIDGQATVILRSQNESIIIQSNGTNWVSLQRGDAHTLDGYHASQTPTASTIPVSDVSGKISLNWIPQGDGSKLDADMLDGYHVSDILSVVGGGGFTFPIKTPYTNYSILNANTNTALTTLSATTDLIHFVPLIPMKTIYVSNLVIAYSAASGTSTCYLGLYSDFHDTVTGSHHPDSLLFSGSMQFSAAGALSFAYNSYLNAGTIYWLAVKTTLGTSATYRAVAVGGQSSLLGLNASFAMITALTYSYTSTGLPTSVRGLTLNVVTNAAVPAFFAILTGEP